VTALTFGSVCSGIEAASVAWDPLGWRSAFVSEIAQFPRAVLSHRFPSTPLRGDFTEIAPGDHDPIDLLVGGTPCQSFSVAGLRRGMADQRGNLALEYLRLADRLRPRWILWENVPGVLSSNGGRDFGSFLGGLAQLGYHCCYRVLDAQFFGLAQRRKRVFVVGCAGDWRGAAAVLLEPASMRRNPPPRREAGERVAATLTRGAESGGKGGYAGRRQEDDTNIVGTLCNNGKAAGSATQQDAERGMLIAHTLRASGFDASEDGTGRGTPLVPIAFHGSQDPCVSGDVTHPLGRNQGQEATAMIGSSVRRLTPRECERLQGFPDDWTQVPYRNKPAADGPRYQALGNSMAVPVMRWIGARIQMQEQAA
jgi:DNA (cytosine-5)-methyltransferase 1